MTGLISGAASLVGTVVGGNKAKKASRKGQAALEAAQAKAMGINDANTAAAGDLYDPYTETGTEASRQLQEALGAGSLTKSFGMDDFEEDPGYQFRQAETQKAIDRRAGAQGQYFAPATLKTLSQFAGDQASEEYDNAYKRFTDTQDRAYTKLLGLSEFGTGVAGDQANILTHGADNNIRSVLGIGDAQAQGITDRGAITAKQWINGAKSVGTMLAPAGGSNSSGSSLASLAKLFAAG